jgi:hypothetical protein
MDYSEIKIDDERDTLIKFDKFEWFKFKWKSRNWNYWKNQKYVSIEIDHIYLSIPLNKLTIQGEQIYKFKQHGISQICEGDIYNINNKSDIIVKILLV